MRPLAFDTETINRPGHGEACQLIAEEPGGTIEYVNFPDRFSQTFHFLVGGKYIAFNADFDIRAITHPLFLPPRILEMLAEYDCAIWGKYRFMIIPGKWFKCWVPGGGGFEIFDLKSFFQGHSLDSAADTYLKDERKVNLESVINEALGLAGKKKLSREYCYSQMDKWLKNPRTKEAVTKYSLMDVKVLSDLYTVLEKSFNAMGIPEPSLYSPGSAAMEIFGPILKTQLPGDEHNEIFRNSFFGGRVEISEMGNIKGPLYYYDIKSAYPFEASKLPDLSTAAWREGTGADYIDRKDIKAGCYEVIVNIPENWHYGPFPLRGDNGKIYFPVGKFKTFIGRTGFEILKEFKIKYELINYWEYYGGSKKLPFNKLINKFFKLRKDPLKSLAVKLCLNSLYGKMAESDNHNKVLPPELAEFQKKFNTSRMFGRFTNFPYAGIITENTRLRLWRVAHKQGAVLMATDGIITRKKMPHGSSLGEFDFKGELSRAYILGCGRYEIIYKDWQKNSKGQRWKSEYHFRGFRGAKKIFDKLKRCNKYTMPEYLLDGKSLKQWAIGKDKSDFNVLKQIKKDIIISDNKRFWEANRITKIRGWFKTRKLSLPIKE